MSGIDLRAVFVLGLGLATSVWHAEAADFPSRPITVIVPYAAGGAGDTVVRLLPPLIVSEAEIADAVARIDRACAAIERAQQAPLICTEG